MSLFICNNCGHVEFGQTPDNCPACSETKFNHNDQVFVEAGGKSKEGAVKHIPSIQVNKACGLIPEESCVDVIVRVGETLHPMQEGHFIQWIDCYVDDQFVSRVMLSANVEPAACFHLKTSGSKVKIVELCNLHGHWVHEASL